MGLSYIKKNNACSRLIYYPVKDFSPNCYLKQNVVASTPEMIQLNGYKFETHEIVTDDGYKSLAFRIPPKIHDDRKKKQPIVLEHGIQVNSEVWTWRGNRSLAFVLVNAGYDVWLVNQRDSGYTTHVKYKMSDFKFWANSLDTVATKGISAILSTVATATSKSGSIIYIGHSRGATLAFMYAAEYPEEAQKILRGVVALSPIVYFEPVFYMKILFQLSPVLSKIVNVLRIPVINYPVEYTAKFYQFLCTFFPYICKLIITLTSGSSSQLSPDDLLSMVSILPVPVSLMQVLQYAQMFHSRKFQKYDYGRRGNIIKYNQEQPPLYNLTNCKLPVYMFYGNCDIFIKEKAVKRVFEELGSSEKEYFRVPSGTNTEKLKFGHNDYFFSEDIEELFYKDLFRVLDKLHSKK
ncbi:lipase member K-like [Zophobas morio]|uniref:lipase member K-like n=1 Tax=Zophobas morio TaxID=2755281 RepID=UPI0030836374